MSNLDKDIKILKEMIDFKKQFTLLKHEQEQVQAISNVLSELETQINNTHILQSQLDVANAEKIEWKKIAEKLVRLLKEKTSVYLDICIETPDEKCADNKCYECIIDWARKEVEKDD